MGKTSDAFLKESEKLETARTTLTALDNGSEGTPLHEAYSSLVSDYEELLSEARFLTKVSDRLEKKLSRANDALAANNIRLEESNQRISTENKKVKYRAKKIAQENKKMGRRLNKFQVAVAVIIFLVFMLVLFGVYILFGDGTKPGMLNS